MKNTPKLNSITVIIPLYKTPHHLIKNINQYKNFKLIILDQSNDRILKQKIHKQNLNIQKYIMINKNIGFAKACNYLLKKVSSKYCLLTQADIVINLKSIKELLKSINKVHNCIIAAPNLNKSNKSSNIKIVNNVIGANFLFDVCKMKKFRFFDEQFFLYWEDVDLCHRIKQKKYKIIIAGAAKAKHLSSTSSKNDLQTFFIRNINFKYGEYLYYNKINEFKKYKPLRQIVTNLIYFFGNLICLKFLKSLKNIAYIMGILKFFFK
jgi:GT2 family glycosyltransferase